MDAAVSSELRRAFGPHPDLVRRPKDERESLYARFAADADRAGDDGLAVLLEMTRTLPERLGLPPDALRDADRIELPPPAIFFRTGSPLIASIVDACASGSYTRRQHPWLLLACFVDPDFEPAVDFPFYLRPRRSDWREDEPGCRMDAWRLAFGLWLYGTARGHTSAHDGRSQT